MDIGLYFTLSLPRPWQPGAEQELFASSLDQVQLADELGFDHAWAVEQHFMEEYSHSSAPEIFLAAASQRTRKIRLGHSVALTPPGYNHPARMAERLATLDLVSGGRIDFGFGNSKSRIELEGFGIDPDLRREMTLEAVEQIAHMMSSTPYRGYEGRFFSMPARNVVPKPVQTPHPPLWIACSDDETARRAGRLGVGALIHPFFDAAEAERVVGEYYEAFKSECVPIGHAVNPNVATLDPFYCHDSADTATEVGRTAHGFFTYAVRYYYAFGRHRPGFTDISANLSQVEQAMGTAIPLRGGHSIGTPESIAERLQSLAAAGVDQTVLIHSAGRMTHEQVTASMRLFAKKVLPRFVSGREERRQAKAEELAPHVEAAFKRKPASGVSRREDIEVVEAYGLSAPSVEFDDIEKMPPATQEILHELQRLKALAMEMEN